MESGVSREVGESFSDFTTRQGALTQVQTLKLPDQMGAGPLGSEGFNRAQMVTNGSLFSHGILGSGPVSLVPDVSDFGLQRSTLPVVGSNPRTLKAAV